MNIFIRVKEEELSNKRAIEVNINEDYNPDADLHVTESIIADLTRRIANTDRLVYIYTLTGIIIATVITTMIRSFIFFSVRFFHISFFLKKHRLVFINNLLILLYFKQLAMKASRNLHNTMFQGVTRAKMYFFHTNPSGRILNRFSKDMGQVDEILPAVMIDVIQIFLQLLGIIIVIVVVNYYFIIPTVVVGVIFYFLRGYYLSASRNIKRIEAISKL